MLMKHPINEILNIMIRLRDPETGCPWDREQDFESIAPYTIEEAYEVADAIVRKDHAALQEELGDLLLQVVYHAQIAAERELFDFHDVTRSICAKMIRRHPHVFNRQSGDKQSDFNRDAWEKDKERERKDKGYTSVLDGLAGNLPALSLAYKIQKRVADRGFDWKEHSAVFAKVEEELDEVRVAVKESSSDQKKVVEEIGDLLFSVVNLARHYEIDSESALRHANRKFESRFRILEKKLGLNTSNSKKVTLEEMEEVWEQIKQEEKDDAYM